MAGVIFWAIDDVLPEEIVNNTYLAFVVGYEAEKMASVPPQPLALWSRVFGFPDRLSTENKAVLIRSYREHSMISYEAWLTYRNRMPQRKFLWQQGFQY
jgi:hypothetical protein